MTHVLPKQCVSKTRLHLVILPTEACSFRCTYCYEDFAQGRMEPQVIEGLKRLLEDRAQELEDLQLSWFGGEPLLAMDLMEELQTHALALTREHEQLKVNASLTTNGHGLGPDVFRRLLDLGVRSYQISLDGPQALHDRTRVLAGGGGTFDRIWDNLLAMRTVPDEFTVLIRIHVHQDNHRALPAFLETCAEAFAEDARFKVVFKTVFDPGRPDFDRSLLLPGEAREQAVESLSAVTCNLGLSTADPDPPETAPICYAAQANSLVVRSDGRLNKCSVALGDERNQVGLLREDGTVLLDEERMRHWIRGLFSGDEEELRCPLQESA